MCYVLENITSYLTKHFCKRSGSQLQAASHFVLFLFCLAAIQETKISQLLLDYGLDQMEREESYETPKYHGHSIDEIRFNDARKLVNFRLISMYIALAYVAIYAMCTLCLLVGTLNN